jgi:hypothetical protein
MTKLIVSAIYHSQHDQSSFSIVSLLVGFVHYRMLTILSTQSRYSEFRCISQTRPRAETPLCPLEVPPQSLCHIP